MASEPDTQSTSDLDRLQLPTSNTRNNEQSVASSVPPAQDPAPVSYWGQSYGTRSDDGILGNDSPIDLTALQFALPPDINQGARDLPGRTSSPDLQDGESQYFDEATNPDFFESDSVPLTSRAQPISGSLSAPDAEGRGRDSFQTVSDLDDTPSQNRNVGSLGLGLGPDGTGARRLTQGQSLAAPSRNQRSRSPSTSDALYRAGSIVRAISQRVVNISGEGEPFERRVSHRQSRSPSEGRRQRQMSTVPMSLDTSYPSQAFHTTGEKINQHTSIIPEPSPPIQPRPSMRNPLKGKSLGIFGPENGVRRRLCDLLVHPFTEPVILLLIILQLILLTVEAAPNVFEPGNGRPTTWGTTWIDYAMLGLFIIFTLELMARIIVSGFILNASEYSTIDRKRGIRAAVADQYRMLFQPQRQKSVKAPRQINLGPSAFSRSFTFMQGQPLPQTVEEQQRYQLARRAFMRHSFNRLDFLAIVSYWITFFLSFTGLESEHHLYVFRMISCLRILRLLALTNGTAIILGSLKKAAPLLVRIAFLISFFWLLFAIIGVQSFKSSLSRQCVWLDPEAPTDRSMAFVNQFQFCGGHVNQTTGELEPWVLAQDENSLSDLAHGSLRAKGFICPRGSICLQGQNPFGGTVSFDNIFQSLEMVFVIISSNTFTDIMYYTTDSDYLAAALFTAGATMILLLWLTNLLIAVITSSFQVIREESRASAFAVDREPLARPPEEKRPKKTSPLRRIYDKTELIWIAVISLGLLAQCFRSATMSGGRARFLDVTEIVITSLLDVEIAIRFLADWRSFHQSWRNLFDLFLALATSIILVPPIRTSGQVYAWLTIFQILRVYRVVLAVPMTGKLIRRVVGNATGIGNLILFVFLMTFIVAILAVQLFRGELSEDEDISFFSIYNSFLGMWQILSSEDWTDILYDVTETLSPFNTHWIGAVFLIGWFVLSFFIVINMFIALIHENFDVSEDEKRLEQVKAFLQKKELGKSSNNLALSNIFNIGRARRKKDPLDYGPAMMEMLLKDAVVHDFLDDPSNTSHEGANGDEHQHQSQHPTRTTTLAVGDSQPGFSNWWGKIVLRLSGREPNPFYSNIRFEGPNDTLDPRQMARQAVSATSARRKAQREYLARHPTYNNALFILPPKNPIRRACQRLVGLGRGSERFDGVEPNKIAWYTFSVLIYAAIVAMVVIACVTTPLYQKQYRERYPDTFLTWYIWTDIAFAAVFLTEAVIKVIADGFFFTPNAYYRSSWGIIDGVVLITLLINVGTLLLQDGEISRAIGAVKALRALRLLNVSNSARDTFHSLIILGWWKLVSAAFVSLSLLIPFAIYGLNLFNGLMISCNDDNDGAIVSLMDCYGEFNCTPFNDDWPMLCPRSASNDYFNFDDFGNSIFILFSILSQEGWVDVSFAAQAITGRGMQPQRLAAQGNALFFIIYNLLGTVFVLTLFIAVFMRNYTEQTGVAFLTAEQRSWLELRKLLRQVSPSKTSYDESEKTWKKWCHKRAIEKRGMWYQGMTAVLVLHLILLMMEFRQEPQWWSRTRDFLFLVLVLIYMANVVIRLVGLGWARFRRSSWDVYSLIAVGGAFISTTLAVIIRASKREDILEGEIYVQVHKSFLVAIVLLLIPRNDALDQLFKTAAASLPAIGNLLATWFVFYIVFAIALTQAFSLTRFGSDETSNINFRTVPHALILLFRMSAGEGWNIVMEDFANIEPPFCVDDADFFQSDCGSKPWARFLFVLWNILSMYIFVNLFVSLIYESFSYVYQRSSGIAAVDRDEIRRFKEAWRSVDPAGTGFISKEAFPRLLGELSGVFEMRIYDAEDSVSRILEDVRNDPSPSRHTSIATTSAFSGVDIERLNGRLAQIDVAKVRERRRRFNIFFEEVMVSADPDRGIAFTTVLMILAHYNIISDSKSLRLEEFLRRRARLQRVDEEVRRRTVLGFFDTWYYSRQFKRHMERKRAGRMTAIPQLDIPDILVDDESDIGEERTTTPRERESAQAQTSMLSVDDAARARPRSWSDTNRGSSLHESTSPHPLSMPRSHPSSPQHQSAPSAFSFELLEPGPASRETSRRTSVVSPSQVNDILDDSAWVESIRRSATVRRQDWSEY